MTHALENCLKIYSQLKKSSSQEEIESYSLLLHNELEADFKEALPLVYENYKDLKERGENLVSRGYTFKVEKNRMLIMSPHKQRMDIYHKFLNPEQILNVIHAEKLKPKQKELALLFLSNENSLIYCNLATNLF